MYVGSLKRGGYDSGPKEKEKMIVDRAMKYRWHNKVGKKQS